MQADRADPVLVAFFDGVGGFQLVTVIGAHLRFADPGIQVAPVMVDCAQQVTVGIKVVRIIGATLGEKRKDVPEPWLECLFQDVGRYRLFRDGRLVLKP